MSKILEQNVKPTAGQDLFDENRVKVTKKVNPSPIVEIGEITYYLKAVVKHSGGLVGGHYTTAVNMETLWVICDDSRQFQITNETPFDGYLFFYETSPLKLSKELVDRISTVFQEQRNDLHHQLETEFFFTSYKPFS